jgi:hypothetical protein
MLFYVYLHLFMLISLSVVFCSWFSLFICTCLCLSVHLLMFCSCFSLSICTCLCLSVHLYCSFFVHAFLCIYLHLFMLICPSVVVLLMLFSVYLHLFMLIFPPVVVFLRLSARSSVHLYLFKLISGTDCTYYICLFTRAAGCTR